MAKKSQLVTISLGIKTVDFIGTLPIPEILSPLKETVLLTAKSKYVEKSFESVFILKINAYLLLHINCFVLKTVIIK